MLIAIEKKPTPQPGTQLALIPSAEVVPLGVTNLRVAFEVWYKEYPRKKARKLAFKAYLAACKETTPEVLLNSLRAYQWPSEAKYIPHPTTWLNGGRWADEPDRVPTPDDDIEAIMALSEQIKADRRQTKMAAD